MVSADYFSWIKATYFGNSTVHLALGTGTVSTEDHRQISNTVQEF
jgi:hypothetical protein